MISSFFSSSLLSNDFVSKHMKEIIRFIFPLAFGVPSGKISRLMNKLICKYEKGREIWLKSEHVARQQQTHTEEWARERMIKRKKKESNKFLLFTIEWIKLNEIIFIFIFFVLLLFNCLLNRFSFSFSCCCSRLCHFICLNKEQNNRKKNFFYSSFLSYFAPSIVSVWDQFELCRVVTFKSQ